MSFLYILSFFFFNTHTHILIKCTEMFCVFVFVFVENIKETPTNQYEDRQHNIKTIKRYEEVTDTSENRRTNIWNSVQATKKQNSKCKFQAQKIGQVLKYYLLNTIKYITKKMKKSWGIYANNLFLKYTWHRYAE